MPAAKRPRGATAIRSERAVLPQIAMPQLNLPRKHLLAIAALIACVVIAIYLAPSETETDTGSPAPEVASQPAEMQPGSPAKDPTPTDTTPVDAVPAEAIEAPWIEQTVRSGDNLSLIFKRAGFNDRDVHEVVSQAEDGIGYAPYHVSS